jgi:hypothetical protein
MWHAHPARDPRAGGPLPLIETTRKYVLVKLGRAAIAVVPAAQSVSHQLSH